MEKYEDPYCYPGTSVLRNIPGFRNQEDLELFENERGGMNLRWLKESPISINDPYERLKETHRRIFEGVFEWAGDFRQRMGLITKTRLGRTVVYCNAQYIPSELARVMGELKKESMLKGLDKATFSKRMAYFYGELDAVHSFREGNSRTLRQFTSDIAREAGYRLDWAHTASVENARNRLYAARDKAVLTRDSSDLAKIFLDGLRPVKERTQTQSAGLQLPGEGSASKTSISQPGPGEGKQALAQARRETQSRLSAREDLAPAAKVRVQDFLNRQEAEKIWKSQTLNADGRIAAARCISGEVTFEQATKGLPEIQHGVVRALARAHARGQERGPQWTL